ncbi:histone-lysine N-methyltransferase SETD1B-like isoform X1 [Mizuhopecten yessoensis]|uniref:histone-lysine N-methyltransferase SETD1B-like isoform X1 n=2 Tax=Mizuhopecten yessoensis TaxID=6573 RepID=UPI000B45D1B3|nr:histone-lysine N-methyltransferase SETD1B-like isoform X1 [Mizuhopecten yessoensis]
MERRRYRSKRDDIYDDGSNIRNVTAVSRMKSLFEAPAADTKPFRPPAKKIMRPMPGAANHGPPSIPPKGDKAEEDGKTANGTAEGSKKPTNITSELPSWKNRVDMFNKPQISGLPPKTAKTGFSNTTSPEENKDENSNTVSANSAKRSSKLNIPTAFSGASSMAPPPIAPKKPVVFPKPSDKTENKPGDQMSPVKDKPVTPRRVITPTQGSTNIQEELQRKFSGKGNDFKSVDNKQDGGQKEPIKPGKLNRDNVIALQKKLSGPATEEVSDSSDKILMRPKSGSKFPNRKSVKRKSLTRTNDGSKFYLVEVSLDDNMEKKKIDEEPDIPPPLEYSDLQRLHEIIQEYKVALGELEGYPIDDAGIIEEMEDVYEAIPADMDEPPIPPPHKKFSRAISFIKPMSEREEYDSDDQDTYDDTINYTPKEPPSIPLPPPPELDLPAPPDELLKPPVPEGPIPSRRKPSTLVPDNQTADTPSPLVPQKDDWPDDVYDDCGTDATQDQNIAEAELEQDDVYEAIPGEEGENSPPATPEKPEEKKEEKKDEKLTAKEKKKREKEEAVRNIFLRFDL